MPNLAVIGGQWGDEGKGKVVDLLAPAFAVCARYQGGPNAGHTVAFGGRTFALHHVPSGIFRGVECVIGAGAVLDPERLSEELELLDRAGVSYRNRLRISGRAHVILPIHRALDAAIEERLGPSAIGTTRRGIGPAYAARVQRWGVRVADLLEPEVFADRIRRLLAVGEGALLAGLGQAPPSEEELIAWAEAWRPRLAPLVENVAARLQRALDEKRPILFEGAQGALLDLGHGTYPYVTSSTTLAGGIPAGLGIPPRAVERVLAVVKAYVTRVGSGPFPTEAEGEAGDRLRRRGREYGTTTGRPRRCGWFDAVAARWAAKLNGADAVALTKFDVLAGVDPLRIAVAYELDGGRLDEPPLSSRDLARVRPVYEELPGFSEPIGEVRDIEALPRAARRFLDRVEELCGCPIGLISVGPDRGQTIAVDTVLAAAGIEPPREDHR
ncbi:MAG: adenylosuccinate synthase [Acidobacteria bacterium]|nr:MAG: adenylosuccinate synthase [Acidobacteriota bacterium]